MSSGLIWQNHPPEKLLAERFHISIDFHPGQRNIIEQLVQGKRVLAIQRTGNSTYARSSVSVPYCLLPL
jgi:hypothetical protein